MVWFSPLIATIVLMLVVLTSATIIGIVGAWAATQLRRIGLESRSTEPIDRTGSSNVNQGRSRISSAGGIAWIARTISAVLVGAMIFAVIMPMILHAAAWEATAGKFGWAMLTQTGSRVTSGDTYGFFAGFVATAWIHSLHGSAIVGLAVLMGTSRVPRSILEASMMEAGTWKRWWRIVLPIAAPWWVTAMMMTAGLVVTEMTVADLYGYRTIADQFYLCYAVEPSLSAVSITCVLPLAFALMIGGYGLAARKKWVAIDRSQSQLPEPAHRSQIEFHDGGKSSTESGLLGRRGVFLFAASLLALTIAFLLVGVPVFGLVQSLGHTVSLEPSAVDALANPTTPGRNQLVTGWSAAMAWQRAIDAPVTFASEYVWSAILAAVTATVAVLISWPIASWGRRRSSVRTASDLVSTLMVCVPGPIVGLVVVRCFQADVPGFRFLYQQTILPTVISLLVRAVPLAYWVIRSGYHGIADSTLDLATFEAKRWKVFWHVERPLLMRSVMLAFVASAVLASGDLPATLPVVPAGVTTVAVRLFGLLHSGARYQEAALSLWYLLALALVTMMVVRRDLVRS